MRFKKYIIPYIVFSLIIITIGYFSTEENIGSVDFKRLGYEDAFFIFGVNFLQIIVWFFLSPLFLSLPLIGKFLFSIGQGPQLTGIDASIYYLSSLSHGFGEIVVGFFVFVFTIEHFLVWLHFFKTRENHKIKFLYVYNLKKIIPIIAIILIVSAFCEVYVSNVLFFKFK